MLPFERLRSLARYPETDPEYLAEAAECLGAFADDPPGLVVASRRLLAHQPGATAVWWLCSRVVAAVDPQRAARDAARALATDGTGARLAGALPFPHDPPVAWVGNAGPLAEVAGLRPDLDWLAVSTSPARSRTGRGAVRRRGLPAGRRVQDAELLALGPTHLLVGVEAATADRIAVGPGVAAVVDEMRTRDVRIWFVVPEGACVPGRLFDEIAGRVAPEVWTVREPTPGDHVVGPTGVEPVAALPRMVDCPVVPELLTRAG